MNSKIILGLAFVAISIGLYGVTNAKPAETPKPTASNEVEVTYKVWRVKHGLAKGAKLTRGHLMVEHLPQAKAALVGIDSDVDLDWDEPMFAVKDLSVGDIVSDDVVAMPGESDYLNAVLQSGFVPYNVTVPGKDVVGGTISAGDLVDISVLSTPSQNLSTDQTVSDIQHLTMMPLLAQIKVLDIVSSDKSLDSLNQDDDSKVTLILQVTNQQLARLTVANRVAEIAVHKSLGEVYANDLVADSADIIRVQGRASGIREFRFN